ncbi:MAG: helix-turn-helix domain-containing protein [Anaerolineae bacterium]|nr:helix-turn-helix domain-containing protein [Thermoflexales bacterium]MDW8395998.1 helix-turn-helix domain-containing protein [Anaerolineae bacterium]
MQRPDFEAANHPVRMRIFQLLYNGEWSIDQIAAALPHVPKPSIYRHVRRLVAAGLLRVASTQMVNGIQKRFYTSVYKLIEDEQLERPGGIAALADHIRIYGSIVAQAVAEYLNREDREGLDRTIARDHFFYATDAELAELRDAIFKLLERAQRQPPAPDRRRWRIFVMGHPLREAPPEGHSSTEAHSPVAQADVPQ